MDIWSNEWWLKPQWREQINLSDEEINRCFEILKSTFNQEWIATLGDDPRYHPLVREVIFGEGLHQIDYLLGLAHKIENLAEVSGFKTVLRSYKKVKEARSAELEMFIASCLIDGGYGTEFITAKPKKGKTPDILASKNGKAFTVECKYVSIAEAEKWITNYNMHFGIKIFDLAPKDTSIIYVPYDQNIDIRSYGYPDKLIPAKLSAELDTLAITNAVQNAHIDTKPPIYISIPGRGEVLLLPEGSETDGRVSIPELNTKFLLNRLFRNGIEAANQQIHEYGRPGIAVTFQAEPADPYSIKQKLDLIISKNPSIYSSLMGVLIFPCQNILKYINPYWVANEFSHYNVDDYGIIEFFDEFFSPIKI